MVLVKRLKTIQFFRFLTPFRLETLLSAFFRLMIMSTSFSSESSSHTSFKSTFFIKAFLSSTVRLASFAILIFRFLILSVFLIMSDSDVSSSMGYCFGSIFILLNFPLILEPPNMYTAISPTSPTTIQKAILAYQSPSCGMFLM